MKSRVSPAVKKVAAEVRRVDALMEEDRVDEALQLLLRARSVLRAEDLDSPWLSWQLCMVLDRSGDPLRALPHIREAVQLDPACPHFLHSYDVILNRLRESLCTPDRDIAEPEVPGLYRALQEEGEADEACHLAMARHHLAHGRVQAAQALVDALLVLNPTNPAAWQTRAAILENQGNAAGATAARAEATALEARPAQPIEPTQPEARG